MALRCLLFSSDEGTAEPICQVLAGLGLEAECCSDAVAAVEKVADQPFQIVIIDWDKQPEAASLLAKTRERKAAERPLTLAIVSDDASVPKALQAGANSILRKPLLVNQVNDTLTTARDLLRAKQESAAAALQAAAAAASAGSSPLPASMEQGSGKLFRAGEFLQSPGSSGGANFVTESDVTNSLEPSATEELQPLKELEPTAASVAAEEPPPLPPPPPPSEPRGLQWYLKTRAATLPPVPAYVPEPSAPAKPELIGYDQTPSHSETPSASAAAVAGAPEETPNQGDSHSDPGRTHEEKTEKELFAYMAGEGEKPEEESRPRRRLGKGAILGALFLASCAAVAAPQAPWHANLQGVWARARRATHAWLNPQPVTPVQAPASHEDFGRPGDEYKLPVAENIPDATTDPSQIRVIPVIDPTAKKLNNAGANAEQTPGQGDGAEANPGAQEQTPAVQAPENQSPENKVPDTQPAQSAPPTAAPVLGSVAGGTTAGSAPSPSTAAAPRAATQPRPDPPTLPPWSAVSASTQPTPSKNPEGPTPTNTAIPSSLKSQMASTTPDAGGDKPVEAALPSIEPVDVPEATERGLLTDQPAIAYPPNAKAQQGTVVLQVLIGRDGTVQDAKFLQGSLAFARAAIDGVKQWKFKPYTMNGRPTAVQTLMTMSFKPAA